MKKLSSAIMLILLLAAAEAGAQSLNDLDIQVVLSANGDARITETRQMTITDRGTECYIGLGNMGASQVKDLAVTDETGAQYTPADYWGAGLTRENKTRRCAIVRKDDGTIELCWGLGKSGERTYITSYTITSLVRGYNDADAIRHVFLDWTVDPKPKHAKVTIQSADPSVRFTPDTCGLWGFRFEGELCFDDGRMVAETTEPMSSQAALYVMAMFPKGMMHPGIVENDSFEHKKQLAFEGSDYVDGEKASKPEPTPLQMVGGVLMGLLGIGMFSYFLFGGHKRDWRRFKNWIRRKRHERMMNSLDYCKEIPLRGNLQQANDMLNAFKFSYITEYQRLLSATVLQLINLGAFGVMPVMNEKGEMEKRFVVNEKPNKTIESPLANKLYSIFKQASGADRVLDPNELETFMKGDKNKNAVHDFVDSLRTSREASYYDNRQNEVRQVYGFKRFLSDFTLMNERNLTEATLWKDYMVWATLFGNAEQVVKDMKTINPEFFRMDEMAGLMIDDSVLEHIQQSVLTATKHAIRAREIERISTFSSHDDDYSYHRSSGRGGRSSRGGGGGGFSGGGGGGGIR